MTQDHDVDPDETLDWLDSLHSVLEKEGIERALNKIRELKPHIDVFWSSGAQQAQLMKDGEVDMTTGWNGRFDNAAKDGAKVDYSFNQALLDYDCFAIPKGAPNKDAAMAFLAEMEFRTLTKRISDALGVEAPVIPDTTPEGADPGGEDAPEMPAIDPEKYECVSDMAALERWIAKAHDRGWVAVDTETTGLNEMTADLVGISLCIEAGEACYIPLTHKAGKGGDDDLFADKDQDALAEGQIPLDDALAALKPLLEDPSVMKIGQNMKYDAKIFARNGIAIARNEQSPQLLRLPMPAVSAEVAQ